MTRQLEVLRKQQSVTTRRESLATSCLVCCELLLYKKPVFNWAKVIEIIKANFFFHRVQHYHFTTYETFARTGNKDFTLSASMEMVKVKSKSYLQLSLQVFWACSPQFRSHTRELSQNIAIRTSHLGGPSTETEIKLRTEVNFHIILHPAVLIYDFHIFVTSSLSFHGFITNQFNDLLPVGLSA